MKGQEEVENATVRLSRQDRWLAQWIGRIIKQRHGATIETVCNALGNRVDKSQVELLLRHLIKEGKAREAEEQFYYIPRKRN